MTFIGKILSFADKYGMFPVGGRVVACVSGGADSMCLAEALLEISEKRGFTMCVAHFNHKLRGGESDRDEGFVSRYCAARGVPFYRGSGDVLGYAAAHGKGVEEAARLLRYGFFRKVAVETGATRVATAHTADDNLETMIFNLARGSGTAGLCGIPPARPLTGRGFLLEGQGPGHSPGQNEGSVPTGAKEPGPARDDPILIRPMLGVTRDDVMGFISGRDLGFVEDSTNDMVCFTRNKIRHRIVPVLKEINPRAAELASSAAVLARADDEYLSALADGFIDSHRPDKYGAPGRGWVDPGFSLDAEELAGLPVAISGRVIKKLCGRSLSHIHIAAVLDLCARPGPSSMLSLPGWTVSREYGAVVFSNRGGPAVEGFEPLHIPQGADMRPGREFYSAFIPGPGLRVKCESLIYDKSYGKVNKSFSSFLFKTLDICGKMTVRPRRGGDFIRLYDRDCTKTLKKLFIEQRVPAAVRGLVPVISDEGGVLAVFGLGRGDRAVPAPGDNTLMISFERGVSG